MKLNERTLSSSLPIARQLSPQTMPPKTGVKIKLNKIAHIGFQSAGVFFSDIAMLKIKSIAALYFEKIKTELCFGE